MEVGKGTHGFNPTKPPCQPKTIILQEKIKKSPLNRYHTQSYVNGSVCDLTNKPRKAEVRVSCLLNLSLFKVTILYLREQVVFSYDIFSVMVNLPSKILAIFNSPVTA